MIWNQNIRRHWRSFRVSYGFITIHYIYIIASVLVGSLLIFAGGNIAYIDALMFAGGASTGAGLNPIDLNRLNTWQQVCIFILCLTCHVIVTSTAVIVVRLYWFHKKFEHIAKTWKYPVRTQMGPPIRNNNEERATDGPQISHFRSPWTPQKSAAIEDPNDTKPGNDERDSVGIQELEANGSSGMNSPLSPPANKNESTNNSTQDDTTEVLRKRPIKFESPAKLPEGPFERRRRPVLADSIETAGGPTNEGVSGSTVQLTRAGTSNSSQAEHRHISFTPTVRRNSLFVGLTEEQREELGGIEYKALNALLWIIPIYFFGLFFFCCICLIPWIIRDSYYGGILDSDGIGRTCNVGFCLTPDAMISFQQAVFPLIILSFIIIAGNTGFPCLLRLIIWILFKIYPEDSQGKKTFAFLLDHPRRCFTLLFPSAATWWLVAVLVILNFLDSFFFLVLDLGDSYVSAIPVGYRILDGIFQAVATRTAGVAVTNLQLLHPALLVSYLVMMYISVYPVAISIRRTNVYEEKSLGVYAPDDEENTSFLATHIRQQLGFDLWYIFLGLFLICIVESSRLQNTNDYWFNIFNILFEVVSAYGCVGLSIGYPTVNAAFSSQFHNLSKLIIVALMIRGRHRGLPYAVDKAIMLPSMKDIEPPSERPSRVSLSGRSHREPHE